MAGIDRQVEVSLNGCRSTCAYVYEVIPVGQHSHVGQLVLSVNPLWSTLRRITARQYITHQYNASLKKLVWNKRSSLFCPTASEQKKVYDIDTGLGVGR